jgi:hypothetical protein
VIILLGNIGYWKLFRLRSPKNQAGNKPIQPTRAINSDNSVKPVNLPETISPDGTTSPVAPQNLPSQFQPSTDPNYGSITKKI